MSVNSTKSYHGFISVESYGYELISQHKVIHPRAQNNIFFFHATSDEFYVKLVYNNQYGDIIYEVDTNLMH